MKYILLATLCIVSQLSFAQNTNGLDNLMPMPQQMELGEGRFRLTTDFELAMSAERGPRLSKAATRYLDRMTNRTGLFVRQGIICSQDTSSSAALQIRAERLGITSLGEDESYQLQISTESIVLSATTDIGAIRGLQTLFQLISVDEEGYYLPVLKLSDAPRFQWRGLMLDASRHFLPVDVIKRNLDGMEAVKLNVLHFHLCDDHGYRIESKLFPRLNEVSSDGDYYTVAELKDIIKYADDRGIRVMPEIDVPGHASALLTAFPELGSKDTTYSLVRNAGVFDPTLNPIKEQTYVFLDELFGEVAGIFPDPYFHIGGDENEGKHWNENVAIQAFMKDKGLKNNHELQSYFNNRLFKILKKYNKTMMGWDEIHTADTPEGTIIHSWRGRGQGLTDTTTLFNAARQGFQTVLSNGYYIDLMYKAEDHYNTDPYFGYDLDDEMKANILGGEATIWSELVTPLTIDTRIWPRMAAIAERYWSPVEVNDVRDMYQRMEKVSLILEHYGLEHIRNQEVILRNLANSRKVEAVRNLVNVLEPMKGYTRNPGGFMYSVFSPYTKLADASTADAPDALRFKYMVEDFQAGKMVSDDMSAQLNVWIANDAVIQETVNISPILGQALPHSTNLKIMAQDAIQALEYIETGKKSSKKWYKASIQHLEEAKSQSGRVELQVIDPIATLIEMTQIMKSTQN
ncbi:beta-N-acetylhexosaminidase [Reichenbachiella agarivorans]|uniref:Beta-N-acetylhexosaminidase n=1 Tax=Reichenbachiella agarivorans TaxID=2979464 RepID=A0ABY6CSI4_9BACT|nr:beta-N-acetylhexosaminidase [Reichenbachiella agarivorans]UXP32408.1 beta-N-acetylhexosaminidase [Reichenbachiella agarivorans]